MHDTDATPPIPQPSSIREQGVAPLPHVVTEVATAVAPVAGVAKRAGLMQCVWQFFARLLNRRQHVRKENTSDLIIAADRAAAALAAQMPPPIAFKGETASTLAIPTSTYAGKPVEQALRKRAEQQFKNLDITRTTIH
jgi:hypothetical protein